MRGVDHLDDQVWPADLAERRIHRPPVRPGGLHRHMRDTPLHHQPGRHRQQLTVDVRNVRVVSHRVPRRGSGVRAVTVTCFLCTSIPPTHGYKISNEPSRPCDTNHGGAARRARHRLMTLRHVLGGNNLGYQGQAPASFLGSGANAPSQTDDSERHRRRVSPTYGWSRQGPWGSWVVHVPHDGWAGCRGAVLYSSRLSRGSAAIRGRSSWLWTAGSHPTMSRAGRLRAAG